jgi:hypothetical protein
MAGRDPLPGHARQRTWLSFVAWTTDQHACADQYEGAGAQALQQMTRARRLTTLVATLRELEATLTDAAISMFAALVGRANLNARKRR